MSNSERQLREALRALPLDEAEFASLTDRLQDEDT